MCAVHHVPFSVVSSFICTQLFITRPLDQSSSCFGVTMNNTETVSEISLIPVVAYFGIFALGVLASLVQIFALLRCRRNGPLSIILQISLADVASIYLAFIEITSLKESSWIFSPDSCPFFKGFEILVNSATIYLLICFNFHVISLWNLHEIEVKKSKRNPLTRSCSDDDSNECLVSKQETNRVVTIDYTRRRDDVSVIFPTIFVWFVSLSLSVPNFTLSSTLRINANCTICAVIDIYYGQVLQYLLLVFKIIIPVALLFLSFLILLAKLRKVSRQDLDNVLMKKFIEIKSFLMFAIITTVFYFLTSLQRHSLQFLHIISHSFNDNNMDNFKMPPLYNSYLSNTTSMYLVMLHYSCATLRVLLCLGMLPKFRYLLRSKVFICCKTKQ